MNRILKVFCVCWMLGLMLQLNSCSEDVVDTNAVSSTTRSEAVDASRCETIPVEEALENLEKFLASSQHTRGGASSSAEPKPSILVQVVRNPTVLTEIDKNGKEFKITFDSLFYVATYNGTQGSAILAADRRIGTDVIALFDEGKITVPANYIPFATDRPIYKDYPTTGPGFFKMQEYGDELLMNPNTVNLANVEKNDTLVGNCDAELISEQNPEDIMILDLCSAFSSSRIRFADMEMHKIDFGYDNSGDIGPDIVFTDVETSDWTITKQKTPLLSAFKYWHQGSPFNDEFPTVHNLFFNSRRASAGCFPLAVAKILTYNNGPRAVSYKGYTVDWNALKTNFNSSAGKRSAAALLISIAKGCNSWYFYNGTFTFPNEVRAFMSRMGYPNVGKRHYDFSYVEEWVDNAKPLIIYAVHHGNLTKSHAWNLDGYKKQKRTVTTTKRTGSGDIISKETKIEEINYVHMDMGWGGNRNGYYVSDLFWTGDESIQYDNPDQGGNGKFNYTGYVRIIKY